jgi:cytochrome c553
LFSDDVVTSPAFHPIGEGGPEKKVWLVGGRCGTLPSIKGELMLRMVSRITLSSVFVGLVSLTCAFQLQAQDAAKVYKTNCVLCHSADGSGDSPTGKALKAKDLRSAEVQSKSDADLAGIITKGAGKMPAFGAKLHPDAINSLVAYIRALKK